MRYAYANGIFGGTGANTFNPGGTMTRGMFVTVLGRMAGVDQASYQGQSAFDDVDPDAYYAPYVAWASRHGIAGGIGDGKFNPDGLVNREQMAVFLVRYFEAFDVDYDTGANITTVPADIDSVSPWAREMVLKLWKTGLLAGDGVNFNPAASASRAEAATLCMRTDKAVETWYKEPGVPSGRVSVDPDEERQEPGTGGSGGGGGGTGGGGSGGGGNVTTYYEVEFALGNGQGDPDDVVLPAKALYPSGTAISSLPTPSKRNAIFLGWYYDGDMTRDVQSGDTLTRSITLYAKMADGTPLSEGGSPDYVSSTDVGTGFTIRLSEGASISDIRIWNISAGNTDVTGDANHAVSVSGGMVSGNWEAGQTYRLEVLNNAVRIYFGGVEQDEAVRCYNFTTHKEKTLNLGLSNGLKYIHISKISDITGNAFHGLLGVTVREGRSEVEQNTTTGTFSYAEGTLKVGDTLAIYDGTRPDQRNLDTADDGSVAYVTVIAVEGDNYTYQTAKPENVLFTPDVLPVPVTADQDGDTENRSITVDVSVLDFSDDQYEDIGLDATTTVDAGDFIVFYNGTYGSESAQDAGYARIVSVRREDDVYIIAYDDQVTQADIMGAMDIYNTRQISGEELLAGVNVKALEDKLAAQAEESGFVEEATQYLAALAMETDGFQQLRDDMNLKSHSFTLEDGAPLGKGTMAKAAAAARVRIEEKETKFIITPRLQHFTDHSTGVRAELSLSFKVVVNPDSDNQIHISVVAVFEQEVLLGLNLSGGAIWKWKWIIPYIYDYRINANFDVGTFTGIGITATAMSKSPEEEFDWDAPAGDAADQQIIDIGRQIKELMDAPDEFFGESVGTNGGDLLEKYAAMLENESDWVEIYNAELFSDKGSVDPFHIIAYQIGVNFVVSANMNVTMGLTFQYGNAKRYNFSLLLFHNEATTETIDLETEHYQFDFYVMGTMGIRAGIRMEMTVGLFSTDLGSIGVSAEVGAYAQLWGYFYYSLSWEKGRNKESRSSGALFIEVGIYLEVGFLAQALKGTFSYNPTLYEKQWPLWSAGEKENVYDFAYSLEEAPTLKMVGMTTTLAIPSSVFQMEWMDLTSGETGQGGFEPDRFRIAFSNPAFRYDAGTGRIVCTPPEKSVKQTTEMRITWGGAPVAFTSKPIERVLQVEWTDPQNAKYITFDTNGGSTVDAIVAGPGEPITLPTATRQGYDFDGWYYNDNGVIRRFSASRMPEESLEVFALWNPKTNTPYKVECYTQEVSGSYTLYDTVVRWGTTDDYIEINNTNAPVFSHFTYDYPATAYNGRRGGRIAADGSLVLKVYYKRDNYTATFTYGEFDSEENTPVVITKPYGATIYIPQLALGGYLLKDFGSGKEPGTPITLTGPMTFHARWEPDPHTPYRVEHYVQSVSGDKYLLLGGESGIISGFGATGESISFNDHKLTMPGFVYRYAKAGGEIVESAAISASGNTVVKLHYDREKYPLQWSIVGTANGTLTGGDSGDVTFGKLITPPVVTPGAGYRFDGWYADAELTSKVDFDEAVSMPAQAVTYYGRYIPETDTLYKVEHYLQDAENPNLYVKVETEELYAETESSVTAQAKGYPHFVENTTHLNRKAFGQVAGDGSLVLRLYYNRETHDALFDTRGGSGIAPVSYRYEQTIQTPAAPTREGYDFAGWTWEGQATPVTSMEGVTMGESDMTFTAHWTAKTYAISYDLKGGGLAEGESNPAEYTIETPDFTLNNPVKTGYTFTGWTWEGQAVPRETVTISSGSVGNRSYTANWQANTYTVFFHAGDDGSVTPDSKNVTFDGKFGPLPAPTRTGYEFLGWDQAVPATVPAKDITLYARWKALQVTYTVEYRVENAEGGWDVDTQTFQAETGSTVSLGDPMGGSVYRLAEEESVTSAEVAGDGSTRLVLVYVRKTYQATFTTEHGEFEEAGLNGAEYADAGDRTSVWKNVPAGGSLAVYAPVPTRQGYTFVKWIARENETDTALDSEATYVAQWTPIQRTVTFAGNGSTGGGMETVTYTYDEEGRLPANGFTRTGYDFAGWNTQADGNGTAYADEAAIHHLLEDLTLYAQWQNMTRRVTFDANGGSGDMPAMSIVYGQPAQQLLTNAFTREYYTFNGWNTRADGKGTAYAEGALIGDLTEDLTLYAQWKIGQATLTFVTGEGGTPIAPITLDYFAAVTPPANPTRSGYVFDGWNPAIPTTMPAGNLTITARWLPGVSIHLDTGTAPSGVTYPVSYNPSDTMGAGYVIVEEDMVPAHPKSLTFAGWVWAGPGELPAGVTIDGTKITLSDGVNVPLYFKAQWRVSIKLTFTIGTAEGLTSGQIKTYIAGTPLPVLEREHWTFKGWYDSSTGQYFTDAPYSNYNSYGSPGLEEAWELCEIYQENISDLKLAGNNKAAIRLQEDITLSSPGGYLSDLDITGLYNDLDGNNKTITITNPNRSLFAKIQPGVTVSNLTVVLANPMVQPGVFGIFSKYNSGTIRNCKVYGTFTCTNTFDEYAPSYVGGFVGYNYGLIENCENHADITSQNGAGGIAGQNANEINSQRTGSIFNCRNYGTITGHSRVGGIVGYLSPGYSSYEETIISTVDNCINYGIVTYDLNDKNKDFGQKIGGIVGEASVAAAITNCTQANNENNDNYVRGTSYVGGIAGYANDCTLTGCTAETLVSGWTAVGGIAGYAWTVTDCHFTGTLEKDYTGYMGTIVGHAEYKNQIINCTSTFEGALYGRFNH